MSVARPIARSIAASVVRSAVGVGGGGWTPANLSASSVLLWVPANPTVEERDNSAGDPGVYIQDTRSTIGDRRVRQPGSCVTFNGTTQDVTRSLTSFDVVSTGFSFSAWLYFGDDTSGDPFWFGDGVGTFVYLRQESATNLTLYWRADDFSQKTTGAYTGITTGWHHVVGTVESGTQVLYVDGQNVKSNTVAYTTEELNIDRYRISNASLRWQGKYWDIRAFDRALTSSEVSEIYQTDRYTLKSDTLFHYKCEERSGTTLRDASGNSIDSTGGGGFTWSEDGSNTVGSFMNDVGYRLNGAIYEPRDESDTANDITGTALDYTGAAPRDIRVYGTGTEVADLAASGGKITGLLVADLLGGEPNAPEWGQYPEMVNNYGEGDGSNGSLFVRTGAGGDDRFVVVDPLPAQPTLNKLREYVGLDPLTILNWDFYDYFETDLDGWDVVTGSPTISSEQCTFDGTDKLTKTITATDELRVRFTINTFGYSAGAPVLFSVTDGTTTLLELRQIGAGWLRIQSFGNFVGTPGNYWGWDGVATTIDPDTSTRDTTDANMVWEVAMDRSSKSIWIYCNERLLWSAVNGDGTPNQITTVHFGPHTSLTGSMTCDNVIIHGTLADDISGGLVQRSPSLVVAAGQSNMLGSGETPITTVTEGYSAIAYAASSTFPVTFDEFKGATQNSVIQEFLNDAANASGWTVIMVAVGGSSFSTATTSLDWEPGGDPYANTITWIERAVECHEDLSEIIIAWHQGESDVSLTDTQYRDELQSLLVDLRAEATAHASISEAKAIVGEIGTFVSGYESVNDGLALVAAADSTVGLASSSGLTDKGDSTHFDNASANTMGQRMATAYNAL